MWKLNNTFPKKKQKNKNPMDKEEINREIKKKKPKHLRQMKMEIQ